MCESGEGERSWNSQGGGGGGGAEHKPGTTNNNDSAIKQHADTKGHEIHPSYMEIIIRK